MLNAIFRPIQNWPGPQRTPQQRKSSPFASTYTQTLDLLERELDQLRARNIVVQADVELSQIRNDGWLKSNALVRSPGVILTFTRGAKLEDEYSYPCDTYNHWHTNLRAIALSLEALRKVDRYGVTSRGEQYQGFKRLAAADPATERRAAIATLEELSGIFLSDTPVPETIEAAYKAAARRAHPDGGGSVETFARLQAAVSLLRARAEATRA